MGRPCSVPSLHTGKGSSLPVKFLEADALDIAAVRSACTPSTDSANTGQKKITVIFIDVSGNRAPGKMGGGEFGVVTVQSSWPINALPFVVVLFGDSIAR